MNAARRLAGAVIIAILVLAGWVGQATAASAGNAPATAAIPAALAPPGAVSPGATRAEAFLPDFNSALSSVDAWWAKHWGQYVSGAAYVPPSLYAGDPQLGRGIYDAPADQVLCGTVTLSDRNAFYCPAGDFLAFDVDLLDQAWTMGDAVIWLAVTHEWGHAVQARIAAPFRAPQLELQADCFAGAALQGMADDGTVSLESGDLAELRAGLTAFADQYPWGAPGDHGTAAQRWAELTTGMAKGFTGCLPV